MPPHEASQVGRIVENLKNRWKTIDIAGSKQAVVVRQPDRPRHTVFFCLVMRHIRRNDIRTLGRRGQSSNRRETRPPSSLLVYSDWMIVSVVAQGAFLQRTERLGFTAIYVTHDRTGARPCDTPVLLICRPGRSHRSAQDVFRASKDSPIRAHVEFMLLCPSGRVALITPRFKPPSEHDRLS